MTCAAKTALASRLEWVLTILVKASPGVVEPKATDMKRAAHWAWTLGLAHRHFDQKRAKITYSITKKGRDALANGVIQ